MTPAPVALFAYNRPLHVMRTVEALKANTMADQTDLFLFSDGPKSRSDVGKVADVREYLQSVTGFRSVGIQTAVANRGLAASIVDGVTKVINRYGRVIVLEDDLVTSPYFLTYMNEALDLYAESERVMHISGYMYPVRHEDLPETFFLRFPSSWGWATWKRAWSCFEKNPVDLEKSFTREQIRRFNLGGAHDFWEQVRHNRQGKSETWAIFWYAAIFRKHGLCLFPRQTLIDNIGLDGTGDHCLATDTFHSTVADAPVAFSYAAEKEHDLACRRVSEFYRENRLGKLRRFWLVCLLRLKRHFNSRV